MKDSSIVRLLKLVKPYKGIVILSGIFALLVNGAELLKPYILKIVIDDFLVLNKAESGLYSIKAMGLLYMGATVIGSLLTYGQVNLMNYVGQEIVTDLREKTFTHIQHLPLSYLDKLSTGRLITRATNDVEALNRIFTDVLLNSFRDIFLVLGIIIVMFRMNVRLALISLISVPIIATITYIFRKRIRENFRRVKSLIGQINGFFAENLYGMSLIQIFNREKEKLEEFEELNDEYREAIMFQIKLYSLLRPIANILQNLTIAALVWYSLDRIGSKTLELGVVYAFIDYVKQFFNPINNLAAEYNTIQSGIVSADRIFELLDTEDMLEDLESGEKVEEFKGKIEFKNVWFAYEEDEWILKDVSFTINPGETVAFVGSTGAGKTTIINLINRFYDIQKGEILLDGKNIENYRMGDLRRNVAVVLQDVFLFSESVKDNIRLNSNISDERVEEAIELSGFGEFADELPGGLDEEVMEKGSKFSAGQRQLLSFARAIAHDPSILVLDEATSNIDTNTETIIQESIKNISKDRTTLIIAHRLSTIRDADKIILLDKGEIVEIGNHEELMEKDSYYRGLHEAQYA